jgi:Cu2+-exporting ATPase
MVAASSLAVPVEAPALASVCRHCGLPLSFGHGSEFCCRGCEEVHRLLADAGLTQYYELGGGKGYPVVRGASDRKWLEPIAERVTGQAGLSRVVLDVQGVHCSACVWLIEELFRREADAAQVVVNPAVGMVDLTIGPTFPLGEWVSKIESFGYVFGPPLKGKRDEQRSSIVTRMGVCIAIAMNTMIFGIAIYCGLATGTVYRLFHTLDFALSLASVLVGGSVFFRSAWQGLKNRVLHLDLPIALGILFAFSSSTFTFFTRGGATSYFDTINVFIALMLVGRFLQERVVAKNRAFLLASDGVESLYTSRLRDDVVEVVRCVEIAEGDRLLVGLEDLVPVDAELVDEGALFSLDWINGEATPRAFSVGEVVPAGAFCKSTRAPTLRTRASFDASAIVALIGASARRDGDQPKATAWWKRFAGVYVVTVLSIAALTFAGWLLETRDLARTLDVVAAVLIVTCPCAFGIATPLAYELAQAGLRRVGLFVRTPGFLDRARNVKRVVFDKTGTLTTGALVVTNPNAIAALPVDVLSVLHALAIRSSHPKSRAVVTAMSRLGLTPPFDPGCDAHEIAGRGLELRAGEHVWRLGAPSWALDEEVEADLVLARDGALVLRIQTAEELRPDAREEVEALSGEGYEAFVLSGDGARATAAAAVACGIPVERAYGQRSPEGKAAWLRESGAESTLFVGDGLNDSLAAEQALCAGTPAIDRPFMAARCDFYLVSPGLRPIRAALEEARRLARVVNVNLAIAIAYNLVTVSLAVAGFMTPLLCAVLMPLSSVSTVLATTAQLGGGSSKWTS